MNYYRRLLKPVFDILGALILLVILSPLILVVILVLALMNNGSVFFVQMRPGLRGKPFKIIKFKTMKDDFDEKGILLPDDVRLTKIGKFIRSTSLDELLQLINVLKGDMSFVGPRPLLSQYLKRYNKTQFRRHEVKPGISGLAQVKGRNLITWEEKFKLDVYYVDNQSFLMDFRILLMTLFNVLKRKGINASDHETVEEFKG